LQPVPSIGLGTNPVSMLELGGAYCPLVNGGNATTPWFVTRIESRDGEILEEFHPKSRKVLGSEDAWLMMHMLKGGIEEPGGTSQALYSYDVFRGGELGGKTGTSSDHRDGWFVGISPSILGVAWTGNDDPSMHWRTGEAGEGSRTALPLFATFLHKVFKDTVAGYKPQKFPGAPGKIQRRWNCPTPWDAVFDTIPDSTAVDSLRRDSVALPK
jgi:penicillin-binding protein 1A